MSPWTRHLVLATRNAHKTRELRQLLGPSFSIDDLSLYPEIDEIAETGISFEENARLKAHAVSRRIRGWILADDSGLEVDALGGEPGIGSARYAGEGSSDAANRSKLLRALRSLPPAISRTARFRCVLVLVVAGQTTATFEGVVEGSIADQERGTDGFGYDSIFVPDGSAQTFAELSGDRKNLISHRAVAAGKLRAFLESCPAGK